MCICNEQSPGIVGGVFHLHREVDVVGYQFQSNRIDGVNRWQGILVRSFANCAISAGGKKAHDHDEENEDCNSFHIWGIMRESNKIFRIYFRFIKSTAMAIRHIQ